MRTTEERFAAKVGTRDPADCWHWLGSRNEYGYGRFGYDGRVQYAHRVAWMLSRGEIPSDREVDHTCGNPSCVNLAHIELVTHAENCRRRSIRPNNVSAEVRAAHAARVRRSRAKIMKLRREQAG